MNTKILIGVPAIGGQDHRWWGPLIVNIKEWSAKLDVELAVSSSAIPSVSKNMVAGHLDENERTMTHANRNNIVARLGEAEWLFFIDHDTVPPTDSLPRLLSLQAPFVSGIYHHRNDPNTPLIYRRHESTGLYQHIVDYERGAVFEVDAIGMGCALIHRSVFKAIRDNFVQYARPWGSRILIHRDDIVFERFPSRLVGNPLKVYDDGHGQAVMVMPLHEPPLALTDNTDFPYYEMEHGRTEDYGFCERAERVGFKPLVDTGIVCKHWHKYPITDTRFHEMRKQAKIAGIMPSTQSKEGPYASA